MRQTLLGLTKKWLEQLERKLTPAASKNKEETYTALSPVTIADSENSYVKALSWALKNRESKDIKNIALTGPYGSGKSSILKTFKETYKDGDLHFFSISLASFKETKTLSDEKLREIEVSVLQQIFYHEDDKSIPDSRFKKIKISSKRWLWARSLALLGLFVSLFWLFFGEWTFKPGTNFSVVQPFFGVVSLVLLICLPYAILLNLRKKDKAYLIKKKIAISLGVMLSTLTLLLIKYKWVNFLDTAQNAELLYECVNRLSVVFIIVAGLWLIMELLSLVDQISLNKVKIQGAEIELGSKHQKSVFNQHLDELLYFFSVRPYNVVIIEDLDRFEETEIFTKLREINLLLNQSEKIRHKRIVFIYAVRDEMFTGKDRTKFFDFIIPVIPAINYSNSSQILLKKNMDEGYELSDRFLESISFVINDMRLLHNVCNEYKLFRQLLPSELIREKLFSIILYKNVMPLDFFELSENKGILYGLITRKRDYIHELNSKVDESIRFCQEEIEKLEVLHYANLEDLRRLYLLKIIEKLVHFHSFVVNGNHIAFDDLVQTDYFEYVLKDELYYRRGTSSSETRVSATGTTFSKVEDEVNKEYNYRQLELLITEKLNGKVDTLKKNIYELQIQKDTNRFKRINELFNEADVTFSETMIEEGKADPFIYFLLRNGYIEEDYIEYISIFHEGSLTRSDHIFYLNVMNRHEPDFNYKLTKVESLLEKIDVLNFKTAYIFNYDLVDYLLEHQSGYQAQIAFLTEKMVDGSSLCNSFVVNCFEKLKMVDLYTRLVSDKGLQLLEAIRNVSLDQKRRDNIYIQLLKYAQDWLFTSKIWTKFYGEKMASDGNFLNIIADQIRLKMILHSTNVKFSEINVIKAPPDLLDYVYENNHYALTPENLHKVLSRDSTFNQIEFDRSNYSCILKSENDGLINYVNDNINEYIENTYLKSETNKHETLEVYLLLLNHPALTEKNVDAITQKVETTIADIKGLEKETVKVSVLKHDKMIANWENVFSLWPSEQYRELLVGLFNNPDRAKELGKAEMPEKDGDENGNSDKMKEILYLEGIDDENYEWITEAVRWWFDDLDLKRITVSKVRILIYNLVVKPCRESYDQLNSICRELAVRLVERSPDKFLEILAEFEFDADALELILRSEKITDSQKVLFVGRMEESRIFDNASNGSLILRLLSANGSLQISESLLKLLLLNRALNSSERLSVFNREHNKFTDAEVPDLVITLSEDYHDIINPEKKAPIPDSEVNRNFLQVLKLRGLISSFSPDPKGLRVSHKRGGPA